MLVRIIELQVTTESKTRTMKQRDRWGKKRLCIYAAIVVLGYIKDELFSDESNVSNAYDLKHKSGFYFPIIFENKILNAG